MDGVLLTPSYAGDYGICKILCDSFDRFVATEISQILIVPRCDAALFQSLKTSRRTVVAEEDLLPRWMVRIPGSRRWRLTPISLPVRGWISQQIMKLSSNHVTDCELLLYADSDVAFVRPVSVRQFCKGNAIRLYHRKGAAQLSSHFPWHRAATDLLGLPVVDYLGSDYICQLVSWRRSVLLDLQSRLEQIAHTGWQAALCRRWQFSECILYGAFATQGGHTLDRRHFLSEQDLSHSSWHYDLTSGEKVDRFARMIAPHHLAVHVQSNLGLDVETHRHIVKVCTEVAAS